MKNSAKLQASNGYNPNTNAAAASRNLYNRQQPMQFAPSYNKRSNLAGYSPDSLSGFMGASSNGRGRNSEANDDDDGDSSSNFGPNFNSNFDGESSNNDGDGDEGSSANGEGQPMNLNQAASGYPGQGDYNNDAGFGLGFGFGNGASGGYGAAGGDGSDAYGPSEGFDGDGRRAKSASSLMGSRNYGSDDDAVGALQYGPNSAINAGERDGDDEGRAGYSPDSQGEGDNDDE